MVLDTNLDVAYEALDAVGVAFALDILWSTARSLLPLAVSFGQNSGRAILFLSKFFLIFS